MPPSPYSKTLFAIISIANESKGAREAREERRVERAKKFVLTPRQKAIAIGTMLGDASLQTQSNGKSWHLKHQMSDRC